MKFGARAIAVGVLVVSLSACGSAKPKSADAAQPTGCQSKGSSVITHGTRARKRVALTFDDGPSGGTMDLLSILKANKVKATFFPQADKIKGRLSVVKREFAEGHQIQNHTFTHADLGGGGPGATKEMRLANDAIRGAIGFTPCVFRAPYDSVGGDLVERARALGMSTVSAEVNPRDYEEPPTSDIISRVLDETRPGSIIVMHDGEAGGQSTRPHTRMAVPTIIKTLKSRGYTFVTVTELLGYKLTF